MNPSTRHSSSKSCNQLSDYQDSATKTPSQSDSKLETKRRAISRLLEKLKNDFKLSQG
jgi:hypothetical protein